MAIPLPGYRDIVELVKKGATIEAQEKIMELREAALVLQEETFTLREKVQTLEAQIAKQKAVRFDKRVYYVEGDRVPHCPYCYDLDQKLIHFTNPEAALGGGTLSRCPHCESAYHQKDEESEFTFFGRRRNR